MVMTNEQFLAMSIDTQLKFIHCPYGISNGVSDIKSNLVNGYHRFIHNVNSKSGRIIHLTSLKDYKSILHPLSDLTKPITHKGETFVPMLRLAQIKVSKGLFEDKGPTIDFKCKIVEKSFGKLAKCTKLDEWVIMISLSEPERADFWIIQTLIEWHFDIAGLIEKSEAIDVNTLDKNTYA